jgi:hypothetical protein
MRRRRMMMKTMTMMMDRGEMAAPAVRTRPTKNATRQRKELTEPPPLRRPPPILLD